ncbi:TetR/AcrR family transcriptional regulator [Virgisporangium aurantiacum]|uniref:TetR family transcriptional regulator n=1 Tax=Virgisporangium aurantiacum TaxID=175570 RepID=A0A8J3ZA15_9ACTN|nr:TetR/AcrR family transcriptional regulator [Virgisporangium aurantiacum]GIJ58020.1 TetR family transcriptional regulator [Virgisporangium aurantiacum]
MTALPAADHAENSGSRRRGEALLRAIFSAALDQLRDVGWRRLTMEGVAACAHTGKAALYRRWASKEDLVVAAIESTLPEPPGVPDLGDIRAELLHLFDRIHSTMYSPPGCALRAIMNEIEHDHAKVFHELVQRLVFDPSRAVTAEVLRRGVARGEVRADTDIDLLADLGPAMLMYRSKVCGGEVEVGYPKRLVDNALMPMIRP